MQGLKWRQYLVAIGTRDSKGVPEFLDELGKASKQVCTVFVQLLSVFLVFIRWIDDGDFWQLVHRRSMRLILLTPDN